MVKITDVTLFFGPENSQINALYTQAHTRMRTSTNDRSRLVNLRCWGSVGTGVGLERQPIAI